MTFVVIGVALFVVFLVAFFWAACVLAGRADEWAGRK